SHPRRAAMVGHRAIFVAPLLASACHRLNRMLAIAPRAVHLEVAADVVEADEGGQGTLVRSLQLPPILAQLRRDPGHANGTEDLLLRRPTDALAFLLPQLLALLGATVSAQGRKALPLGDAEDAILVNAQAARDPECAHGHVMGLGARKIVQCSSIG